MTTQTTQHGLTTDVPLIVKHKLSDKKRAAWNKGKKMSNEFRKKISDAHKGQKAWNKGLKDYINSGSFKKGHEVSLENRKKISNAQKVRIRKPLSQETKIKIGNANRGDRNGMWTGDKVSYSALHTWINKLYGHPEFCEICGTEDANNYEWANLSGKYMRDRNDFLRSCIPCHRKHDKKSAKLD